MSGRSQIFPILLWGLLTYGFAHTRVLVSSPSRGPADDSIRLLAEMPPLGWNSWDGYGTTVNEEQVKANALWFAQHLKPYGWEYIVVDMEWFVTNPMPEGNSKLSQYSMDAYGRYTPAPGRFPSSRADKGFKTL